MSLPEITLWLGLDRDVLLVGPGIEEFDFDDYSEARFISTALEIEKSTDDASELQVRNSGADLLIHFLEADLPDAAANETYQLIVKSGSRWLPVCAPGPLRIRQKG